MTTSKADIQRVARALRALGPSLSGERAKAAEALAAAISKGTPQGSIGGQLTAASIPPKRLREWRRLAETLRLLAGSLEASATMSRTLAELETALTVHSAAPTQPVVARTGKATKRAADARSRRSSEVTDTSVEGAQRAQIVAELKSRTLTPERQKELMASLTDKTKKYRAADYIEIAKEVTGSRHNSGKAALEELRRWTWKRVQTRLSNESWAETSATRL